MKKETLYPEFEITVVKSAKKSLLKKDNSCVMEISTTARKLVEGKHYLTKLVGKYPLKNEPTTEDYLAGINSFNTEVYKFMLEQGVDDKSLLDDGDTANQSEENRLKV